MGGGVPYPYSQLVFGPVGQLSAFEVGRGEQHFQNSGRLTQSHSSKHNVVWHCKQDGDNCSRRVTLTKNNVDKPITAEVAENIKRDMDKNDCKFGPNLTVQHLIGAESLATLVRKEAFLLHVV